MVRTFKLESIHHAVDVGITLRQSWFRGHPRVHGELLPKIFRSEFSDRAAQTSNLEHSLCEAFKQRAPSLSGFVDPNDDSFAWLFLMQHHGLPTRLLDWSTNILVALFFVVEDPIKEDGELWAFDPMALNKLNSIDGLPSHKSNPQLQYLAAEPTVVDPTVLLKANGMNKAPYYPIAFLPTHYFPRMVSQQSAFTIHPLPAVGNSMTEALCDPKHLVRYIVSPQSKDEIRMNLSSLGISWHTLFPDLDHLAKHLRYSLIGTPFIPPDPPQCGGLIEGSSSH